MQNNPYIGPRPFRPGEKLPGRDRETAELFNLLIAERIVLLHSPSGAGKTSLLQAGLLPALTAEGFLVRRPLLRVSEQPTPDEKAALPDSNRYVLSVLLRLEQGLEENQPKTPLSRLAEMKLVDYLAPATDENRHEVFIFDQFEEILTLDPNDQPAKAEFFEQLGVMLRAPRRWALFAIREEYLAALAPYVNRVPTRLSNTFRLDLLDAENARAAILEPAEAQGVTFHPDAAAKLLDDLRLVRVQQPGGGVLEQPGPYVEPVHLQVACYELWDDLAENTKQVNLSDLQQCGDVSAALAGYYAKKVREAALPESGGERAVREWFSNTLITPQGIRGQVMRDESGNSEGLSNEVIWRLVDAYLVRSESRRSAVWYELAHDRLIRPILKDNNQWFQQNLNDFQRQALLWEDERPDRLLLHGAALAEAETWAQTAQLTPAERDFLQACLAARQLRRQTIRRRRLAIGGVFATLLLLILGLGYSYITTRRNFQAVYVAEMSLAQRAWDNSNLLSLRELVDKHAGRVDNPWRSFEWYYWRQLLNEPILHQWPAGNGKAISALTFTRQGEWLITGSLDKTIKVWDARANYRELFTLQAAFPVHSLAASADGRWLIAAGEGRNVTVWDTSTRQPAAPFPAGNIFAVALSADGRILATGGNNGAVRLWDFATRAEKPPPQLIQCAPPAGPNDTPLRALAFAPEGYHLAVGCRKNSGVWEVATGQKLKAPPALVKETAPDDDIPETTPADIADTVFAVAFSPDGQWLAMGNNKNETRLCDARLTQCQTLRGHSLTVSAVAFSPDSKLLASAGWDRTVRIWDVAAKTTVQTLKSTDEALHAVTFAGPQAIITGNDNGTATLWDTTGTHRNPLVLPAHEPRRTVYAVAFAPDSAHLATGNSAGVTKLWDAATGNTQQQLAPNLPVVRALAYSPDGQWLLSGQSDSKLPRQSRQGAAQLWRIDGSQTPLTLPHDAGVMAVAFSPDSRLCATAGGGANPVAKIWEVATGRLLRELKGHRSVISALAFSPDGQWLATGSYDQTAKIWNAATGQEVCVTPDANGHEEEIYALSFAPGHLTAGKFQAGKRYLATGSKDNSIKFWSFDKRSLQYEFTLLGHSRAVTSLTFAPDGLRLLSGSYDKTAKLWDLETRQEILTLAGHDEAVRGLAFAPDGQRIATASDDGTARIWHGPRGVGE